MNQQEIFQNMTKGKLFRDESGFVSTNSSAEGLLMFADANVNDRDIDEREANTEAIITAVNATYGKGINPKGIEKMKTMLEFLQNEVTEGTGLYSKIKEALTAAKFD